jgi:AcrR family transcriptional regulator
MQVHYAHGKMKEEMSKKAQSKKGHSVEKCPRAYRMGQRGTAMEETRARVLVAARELILGENALAGFSMEAVARQAGITRMTVYHRFGSKRGLLEALFDDMGMRGFLGEKLPDAFSRPDAMEALQSYIEAFCDFWGNDRVMNRRLRGFAALDKEFAAAIASRYERRHRAIETLVHRLSEREIKSSPTERKELVQTLLALTGFEFYDVIAGERNPQEVAPIVFQLVLAALSLKP